MVLEFELIARFFARWPVERPEVVLGVGDDAAVLALPPGHDLLVDVSQWALERELPRDAAPDGIAHRALAAALARLLARGAEPFAFTLALTLSAVDEDWLEAFSAALVALAERHRVALIGGDTTRGPLSLTLHVQALAGERTVPVRGAASGDLLYVTGPLGGAALASLDRLGGVHLTSAEREAAEQELAFPEPPAGLDRVLAGVACAASPCPLGLEAAIQALLADPDGGARVELEQVPVQRGLAPRLRRAGGWDLLRDGAAPTQVCFAVPAARQRELMARLQGTPVQPVWIGTVERASGVRFVLPDGSDL